MHIILFLFLNIFFYQAHSNEWTWFSGNNTKNVPGNYGTIGLSSINNYPGSRHFSVSWFDSSNKTLWLFGGNGFDKSHYGLLNDLWSFSIESNEWTWVSGNNTANVIGNYGTKGVSSKNNYPGSREGSISWFDSSKKTLWLFGGFGFFNPHYGELNDLWSFSIETNEWTWVSGNNTANVDGNYGTKGVSSINNYPGSREYSISWFDSSNKTLWLFGGISYINSTYGFVNDLWSFSIESNEWTWVSGNNTINVDGNYGTKGVSSINNYPGSRLSSISWFDSSKKTLWLFGGNGYFESSEKGWLNDLWSFSIETNEWTWVSGNNTFNVSGNYGTKGVSSINNYPGSRHFSVSWFDSSKKTLWLFGGYGSIESSDGHLNDLWSFSIETNEWTWVSGNNTANFIGNYGTKGKSSINNYPGGRYSSISWFDSSKKTLWLFGGYVYFLHSDEYLNDLWSFKLIDDDPISEPEEGQEEPEDNSSGYYETQYGILIELAIIVLYLIIY